MIPAHYRGRVDIAVNGTYWAGALIGALRVHLPAQPPLGTSAGASGSSSARCWGSDHLPAPEHSGEPALAHDARSGAGSRSRPSPRSRWTSRPRRLEPAGRRKAIEVRPTDLGYVALLRRCSAPSRALDPRPRAMMVTQSFLYNAIFFTYALVLTTSTTSRAGPCRGTSSRSRQPARPADDRTPVRHDRARKMILHVLLSGDSARDIGLPLPRGRAQRGDTDRLWCLIFFLASAGASSAYLTVSEIFPLELPGEAISFFFAISQYRRPRPRRLRRAREQPPRPVLRLPHRGRGHGRRRPRRDRSRHHGRAAVARGRFATPLSMVRKAAGSVSDATRSGPPLRGETT